MQLRIIAVIGVVAPALFMQGAAYGQALTLPGVNGAEFSAKSSKKTSAVALKAQVLLDRAGFSPGAVDGSGGENFAKALKAFQRENGLASSGKLDQASWAKLVATSSDPVLTEYEITANDVKGPLKRTYRVSLRKWPS